MSNDMNIPAMYIAPSLFPNFCYTQSFALLRNICRSTQLLHSTQCIFALSQIFCLSNNVCDNAGTLLDTYERLPKVTNFCVYHTFLCLSHLFAIYTNICTLEELVPLHKQVFVDANCWCKTQRFLVSHMVCVCQKDFHRTTNCL
jgi:hypothetical protein